MSRARICRRCQAFEGICSLLHLYQSGVTPPRPKKASAMEGKAAATPGAGARELESELGHSLWVRVREGEAASVILEAAEEGREPTLIAVGRRGLGRINRLRLGSVSADVLRSATGPVLIVPAPDGA